MTVKYTVILENIRKAGAVKEILASYKVPVTGETQFPPSIYADDIPEVIIEALVANGCIVEKTDEIRKIDPRIAKIDPRIAATIIETPEVFRTDRTISVLVRTNLSPYASQEALRKYEPYRLYPGFGSTFIMTLSPNEVEEILNSEWCVSIREPMKVAHKEWQ